jgi:hypothetical protein
MNTAKIAAALHALADAFLEGSEVSGEAVAPSTKKGGKKTGDTAAVVTPTIVADSTPAPTPTVPSITKDQLNRAVLKVAAKSRDTAEAILAKFGAKNTVTLPPEQWQAVYDAFEEEIAKQDAAAVQVAQASLV